MTEKFDLNSPFFKNCKKQRKRGAKICDDCPFRWQVELFERAQIENNEHIIKTEETTNGK